MVLKESKRTNKRDRGKYKERESDRREKKNDEE